MEKIFFSQGNYHRKQFFTGKFVILFSNENFAPLIFCFDLNSTKILSTYHFIFTVFLILYILRLILNVFYCCYFPGLITYITSCQNNNCNNAVIASSKVCFITNNGKGLQSSKKWLNIIENNYWILKNKLWSNGVLFRQTYTVSNDENTWADAFIRIVHPTPVVLLHI